MARIAHIPITDVTATTTLFIDAKHGVVVSLDYNGDDWFLIYEDANGLHTASYPDPTETVPTLV